MRNDLVVYQPSDPRYHVDKIIDFVVRQFKNLGRTPPDMKEIKNTLAFVHEWATSGWGYRYTWNMKGYTIMDLDHVLVSSVHYPMPGFEIGDYEGPGEGFYLYRKEQQSDFEKRRRTEPCLTEYEKTALSSYYNYASRYGENRVKLNLPAKDMELVCWVYLMYASSDMGEDFFCSLEVWNRDILDHSRRYHIDDSQTPWIWSKLEDRQYGGGAIMMCFSEVYQQSYSDMFYNDEEVYATCPEHVKKVESDMELQDIDDIVVTGRTKHDCRICLHSRLCVEDTSYYDNTNGIEYVHYVCSECREKLLNDTIATTISYELEGYFESIVNRCPAGFMKDLLNNFSMEACIEIIQDGLNHGYWSKNERPLDPKDAYSKLRQLAQQKPNKVRHMAAYTIIKQNKCIVSRMSDKCDCGKLNYRGLEEWYLLIKQHDFEERLALGEVKRSGFRLT